MDTETPGREPFRMEKRTSSLRHLTAAAAALLAVALLSGSSLRAKAAESAGVKTALIQGGNVVVATQGSASSSDGLYHLYAQEVYQSGTQGTEIAQAPAAAGAAFAFPLNKNTADSNLFRKFQLVVLQNGVPTAVGNAKFITNPESAATHTAKRHDAGKKGLLPAAALLHGNQLNALGIRQITYNLPIGNLCNGSGVSYTYNGKTYHFSQAICGQYDFLVPQMNKQGIQVSLIILNNLTADPTLIHPLSRDFAGANYYAFNTAEPAAVEKLEAIASFLGSRYSGAHGTVDNWIIGNEVNARQEWNYMTPGAGMTVAACEYEKALRIFYNGIRSENANARIYTSIDYEWNGSDNVAAHYAGRPFLDAILTFGVMGGNYDWNLAIHPYNAPLTDPIAWVQKYAPRTADARFDTMYNINVVTDYLCTPLYKNTKGQVRYIKCSEQGYTSTGGEQLQAASVIYAYRQAMANRYIDGFILARELDDAGEIAQGLATGLLNVDLTPKMAYTWYANADSANVAAAASAIIGVPDLNSLLVKR